MSAGCFYCDQRMRDLWDGTGPTPDDLATRDHVFPRWMLKDMGDLSDRWRQLNHVRACYRCNHAKGDMHPLDWLATLAPPGRARLRSRLGSLEAIEPHCVGLDTANNPVSGFLSGSLRGE